MFNSVVARRTNPMNALAAIDLGRLAEGMIFYQKVHVVLTRTSLDQLLTSLGPDLTIELFEDGSLDALYLDSNFAVRNGGGGAQPRNGTSRRRSG